MSTKNKAENVELLKEPILQNRRISIREADNMHLTLAQSLDSVQVQRTKVARSARNNTFQKVSAVAMEK
jgi:2'-5' RNA ligase